MSDEDLFKGYGINVRLKTEFPKICEVLTRIGIGNYNNKTLVQTGHIFHKRGEYAIMHFKEMFLFDGKPASYTDEDEARRNRIVKILESWGMIEVIDDISVDFPVAPMSAVNIISRDTMKNEEWNLIKKYTLGKG
jgi:hypothetical protein